MTLPTDSTTLVLLHGFCLSPDIWQRLRDELPESQSVITPDLHSAEYHSIREMAAAVIRDLDENGVSKAIVAGHSMGGYVALEMLNMAPERISGLALVHSTALADTPERRSKRDQIAAFIQQNGSAAFAENFVPTLFFQPDVLNTEVEQLIRKASGISDAIIVAATMAMKKRVDHLETLKRTAVPVLYLCGRHDSFVPLEMNEEEMKGLQNIQSAVSDQASHMSMLEDVEWLSVQMTQYITTIE